MTDYKLNMRSNYRVTPEITYIHLMEAIEESQRRFLKKCRKRETLNLSCNGQARLSSKKWLKIYDFVYFYISHVIWTI